MQFADPEDAEEASLGPSVEHECARRWETERECVPYIAGVPHEDGCSGLQHIPGCGGGTLCGATARVGTDLYHAAEAATAVALTAEERRIRG